MSWTEQLFNYCERATNPDFWAEPINAVTNLAFILAAFLAFFLARKQPKGHVDLSHYFLILTLFCIGVGSGLFHTYATRWSLYADVIPIMIFIFAFLIFALYRLLDLKIVGTFLGLAAFIGLSAAVGEIKCDGGPCLNGTISYLPAFIALILLGAFLLIKRHPAGSDLIWAAVVFFISASFRTVDMSHCHMTVVHHHPIGTHFLWHCLNAVTLYILLRAAILHTHISPKKQQ